MELRAITYNYTQDGMLQNKVVGIFERAELESALLYAVITKALPNKRCVLNNYIGTPLEAINVGSRYVQLKLKKYTDWFSVPIDCVSLL